MRECGECGGVRQRSILLKGPSEKELAVQPVFMSYMWFSFDILTLYSYITLFHLCLSFHFLILPLVLILGVPNALLQSYPFSGDEHLLCICSQDCKLDGEFGDLVLHMNRREYLYSDQKNKSSIQTIDSKLERLHTTQGLRISIYLNQQLVCSLRYREGSTTFYSRLFFFFFNYSILTIQQMASASKLSKIPFIFQDKQDTDTLKPPLIDFYI